MRTSLFILVVAMLVHGASFAQEKISVPALNTEAPASDGLIKERRELSGELKNVLGTAEGLTKRATDLASAATGADRDKYTGTADALKDIQTRITEQLNLVNKVTAAESKGVFANAQEFITSTKTALEEHKGSLVATASGKVPVVE